jgi:hypothetical protein
MGASALTALSENFTQADFFRRKNRISPPIARIFIDIDLRIFV